ncbi:Variant-specific surface protein [Giardia duodenalis]|uniref:Variant-specific surface protein n=1 Tax=Giardia intestinalis TaxID=5741 RepID=V6TUQ4_GIAIN|nr:Variant-specific surface protein [Giardia intestinalis]
MGHSCIDDSAWWTLLLLLHPVLHRCSAGHFLFMGGCYNTRAAPGSGVCREAGDGACRRHTEKNKIDRTSAKVIRASEGGTCIQEATSNNPESTKCKTGKCDVTIGGNPYCSQCSKPDEYLIDGACTAQVGTSGCKLKGSADGTCESCGAGYFLHKGWCYKVNQAPGNLVCADTVGSTTVVGTCDVCKDGYFKNLEPAATKQSCIACNETADINGLAGVAGCTACTNTGPAGTDTPKAATCSACDGGKIVKTDKDKTTTCVTEAQCTKAEGFFVKGSDTKTCEACGDDNCATCAATGMNQCSKCKTTGTKTYLKGDARAGTCVTEVECTANNDHYIDNTDSGPNGKTCKACSTIAGCSMCSSGTVCTKCTNENYLKTVSGVTTCVTDCGEGYFKHTATDSSLKTCQSCSGTNDNLDPAGVGVAGCAVCTYSDKVTCTKCDADKYLKTTSDSTSCVEASGCGSGFFPKADDKAGNRCVPCGEAGSRGINNCAECSLFPYK